MIDIKRTFKSCIASLPLLAFQLQVFGNNLSITNTTIIAPHPPDGTAQIQFDISWDNAWRYPNGSYDDYFHDAVWVFFKVRPEGSDAWRHVIMEDAGFNPNGFSTGTAGDDLELLVPVDGLGMFIRRSTVNPGSGSVISSNVTAQWNLAASGISASQQVNVYTFGLEMAYVASGPFWVGDGISSSSFTPTLITTNDPTQGAVLIDAGGEDQWQGGRPAGQVTPTTADWPNGYDAYYIMKYSITHGQYADFLNMLSEDQATSRVITGFDGSWPSFTAPRPDLACSSISWADGTAFAAWSGLRPMTELEYEKSCRGPLPFVPGEYAWGTATIEDTELTVTTPHNGTETVLTDVTAGAANVLGSNAGGPLRVGIFATNNADRVSAGAGYWGAMELSGNLYERSISIGHANGREYTGLHGDGVLTPVQGLADIEHWPDANAAGAGFRGGHWSRTIDRARVSDREYTHTAQRHSTISQRSSFYGWRGARTAPDN